MSSLLIPEAEGKQARYPKLHINVGVLGPRIKECVAQLGLTSEQVVVETFDGIGAMSRTATRGEDIMIATEEISTTTRKNMQDSGSYLKAAEEDGEVKLKLEQCISKIQTALAIRETAQESREKTLAQQATKLAAAAEEYSGKCEKLAAISDSEYEVHYKKLEKQWEYTPEQAA
eukprot:TRINITY_DN2938_c0_g7_i1.p1 TRINITY_DN2938_c0_g7~~TRINITY_DN2938_c0_g7_i1.p1  ORF type:complete len:192 (+),score=39.88 TRINITY_DN2938_c0_g7_i1:57-578(+)